MFLFRAVIMLLALFMGVFFTLFILTALEAKSPRLESIAKKIHNFIPEKAWLVLFFCTAAGALVALNKYTEIDYVRSGILAGLISGFFLYFKSGPNVDREQMEREAQIDGANPTGFLSFLQGPKKKDDKKTNNKRPGRLKDNIKKHKK